MGFFIKVLNLGFGVASVVKDSVNRGKLEEVMNELVERGEMSREQAKQHIDSIMQKRAEDRQHVKEVIRSEVNYWKCDSSGTISKEEFAELSERLKVIEDKVQQS